MTPCDVRDIARNSFLLRGLPDDVANGVLADASPRETDRGDTIFLQGETARVIHVVIDGWVKLYRVAANGNEAIVNVFTRRHSFGEAVALRGLPYPVSAEAVSACTLLVIPARSLVDMLRREPELALAILSSTFRHLNELVGQVEQIKSQTGAQRLAGFLVRLCDREEGTCIVTLPYDKAVIAGRLGMKPESLSRAFSRLRQVGVHVARHHARIDDVTALCEFAAEDPANAWSKLP